MLIYKIATIEQWRAAKREGVFAGSPVDLADGFIHFSTAEQARETAARHFADRRDLVLVAFEADALGPALRFEPSRGGALFPHLYASLDPAKAEHVWDLPLGPAGRHTFPNLPD